jgi:hypothetical protein
MKKIVLIIFLMVFYQNYGQKCFHTNLSKKYNYGTSSVLGKTTEQADDGIFEIRIEIVKKGPDKKRQHIVFFSGMMHFQPYSDCNAVRSYMTGFNENTDAMDNDYGDFIVADFNFDGKEDLAVKREEGGNGGPLYNYYLQNESGTFVIDIYLSETMIFFPTEIDSNKKTLMTLVHANAYQMNETTYKLNSTTGKWKEVKQRLVD